MTAPLGEAVREVAGTDEQADRLASAVEAAGHLWLLDVVSELAERVQLPTGRVEVRLVGRNPELVYVDDVPTGSADDPAREAETARISLRLPPSLKREIEHAAAHEAVSVNTWIVRTLSRTCLLHRPAGRRRMTGYGRG